MEIQNIVAHYKRLGKNEERYIVVATASILDKP